MAVTKATYTATATWTAAQLATVFQDAFVAAGLMTSWYDSFLNTVENRVLEVVYDGSKTYGKAYYWFMFTTTGVHIQIASGWNASTHVPTGTQYVDYFATTTNAITNHRTIRSLSNTTTVTLTRYTSAVDADFSWFVIRNGTSNYNFFIAPPAITRASWLDLSKVMFHPFVTAVATASSNRATITFPNACPAVRSSYLSQGALRGATTLSHFTDYYLHSTHTYGAWGNANNSGSVNAPSTSSDYIIVPIGFNNTNPAYSTDANPVFTGPSFYSYLNEALPADFGISFHYANNTMAVLDTLVVSAGVEEWEILSVANNATVTTCPSPLFLARTV